MKEEAQGVNPHAKTVPYLLAIWVSPLEVVVWILLALVVPLLAEVLVVPVEVAPSPHSRAWSEAI